MSNICEENCEDGKVLFPLYKSVSSWLSSNNKKYCALIYDCINAVDGAISSLSSLSDNQTLAITQLICICKTHQPHLSI